MPWSGHKVAGQGQWQGWGGMEEVMGSGGGVDIKEAGLTGHMEDEGQQYSQASGLSDWFYAADLPWGGSTWGGAGFEPRY